MTTGRLEAPAGRVRAKPRFDLLTLALCAAFPAGLWAARFLTEEERERLGAMLERVRSGEVLPPREVDEREAASEAAVQQAAWDVDRGGT